MEREMASFSFVLGRVLLLFVVVLPSVSGDQLSAKECEDLGFTGLALCSDCDAFAEYVKNDGEGLVGFPKIDMYFFIWILGQDLHSEPFSSLIRRCENVGDWDFSLASSSLLYVCIKM